jgi:hypothetical protein
MLTWQVGTLTELRSVRAVMSVEQEEASSGLDASTRTLVLAFPFVHIFALEVLVRTSTSTRCLCLRFSSSPSLPRSVLPLV